MKQILAVIIGLMLAGVITGITVPLLPEFARRPWYAWTIVALSIAGMLYLVSKAQKAPRE
jgi:hypothetical protein